MRPGKVMLAAGGLSAAGALAVSRMKPSTRAYIRLVGWHRPDLWLHGMFYLSRTLDYVKMGRRAVGIARFIPRRMRTHYAQTYHGKLVPLEEAQKLVTVGEDIEVRNLENVIPFRMCRDIVLQNPDAILACKCVCRMSSSDPCRQDEVCILVGEPFVSYVLDHQPHFCRRVTPEEAVEILRSTDEEGCLHAAFFKDIAGGRFYAICNCCSCCCVAIKSHRFAGVPFFGHSGLEPVFDAQKCNACSRCVKACHFEALSLDGREGPPRLDREACMGCGSCRSACRQGAIELVEAAGRPAPLRLDQLLAVAK